MIDREKKLLIERRESHGRRKYYRFEEQIKHFKSLSFEEAIEKIELV